MTTPIWATYDVLEWGEIPGTYQLGSAVDVTSDGGAGDVLGVGKRLNYSGMALTTAGEVVLAGCGGHTDYHPNEVAGLLLTADVPSWVLRHAPSDPVPNGTPYAEDGNPAATHTYWSLVEKDGVIYRMYTRYSGDSAYNGPESNAYTLSTNTWAAAGTIADAPSITEAIDSDGNLWGHSGSNLYKYTLSTNTWSTIACTADITGAPIVYDPTNDDFFCFCWGDGQATGTGTVAYRVSKTGVVTTLTINSSAAYTEWQNIQAIYQSVVKHPTNANGWIIFSPAGAGTITNKVYSLILNSGTTYDMAVVATTGASLPPCNPTGTYNRFAYCSTLQGFVYMPMAEVNMLFLRWSGTPAPGRTSPNPNLKFLTKLQDSLPTEEITGRTITKHGSAALDSSGEGFLFGSSGDILTVSSWPYFTPPFTMGVRLKQTSGSGSNVGLIGINIDNDSKVFTLHLDTANNAHAWSRASDIGDAAQPINAFDYGKWFTYAAVFHADGSRSVYDSTVGMVTDTTPIDMSGSSAELYIGSYPRSDTPWSANGIEAWLFFMTEEQDKGDLDLIAAQPESLLVAALPDLTATGASTQAAQTSAGAGAVKISGTGASTQAAQTSTAVVGNKSAGVAASTAPKETSAATGAVKTSGTSVSTQAAETSAGAGTVAVSGAAASTQALETSAVTGSVGGAPLTGTGASTQTLQTSTLVAALGISGTGASTQAAQTSAGTGTLVGAGITGTGASTQALETTAATGVVGITGTGAALQQPATTAASGAVATSGTAASTQALQTSIANAHVADPGTASGSAASTQAAQTSAAAATVSVNGTGASTQARGASAAAAASAISGAAASTQALETSAGAGDVEDADASTGTGASTQAAQTSAAAATVAVTGVAATAQRLQTSIGIGHIQQPGGDLVVTPGFTVSMPLRIWKVKK